MCFSCFSFQLQYLFQDLIEFLFRHEAMKTLRSHKSVTECCTHYNQFNLLLEFIIFCFAFLMKFLYAFRNSIQTVI